MITITKNKFKEILEQERISDDLLEQGITIIMPLKSANEWLKALRSGEWIQAEGVLNDETSGGFCCLGVQQYCQLKGYVETDMDGSVKGLPSEAYLQEHGIIYADSLGYFGSNPYLFNPKSDAAGLNDDTFYKEVKVNQHKTKTVVTHIYNFSKIADMLEQAIAVY